MIFVGRDRETAALRRALLSGRNVLLSGKYGIGRTTLLRHLGSRWPGELCVCFADFSRTPAVACRALAAQLLPAPRRPGRRPPRYGALLAALAGVRPGRGPRPVLALDDVARLTPAKLQLVRRLAGNPSWRIVVIVERFLPRSELVRLLAWLHPVDRIALDRLDGEHGREYFRRVAEQGKLGWDEDRVAALARRCGGYPLEMALTADRALGVTR